MSHIFKKLFVLIIFIMSGCSSISVMVDHDRQTDFSTYKKYKWIKQKKSDDSKSIYKNEINKKRFATTMESVLAKKGFERTDGVDYDFSVVYHLRFDKKVDITGYGYRFYPSTGYSERYIQKKIYQQGSIIVDIIDAKEKLLVWRGAAEGILEETDDPEQVIKEAVKAILKDFPPKNKK